MKRDVDQRRAGQLSLSNQVSGGGKHREAAGNERKLKSQREYNGNGFRSDVKKRKKMSTSLEIKEFQQEAGSEMPHCTWL